MFINLATLQMLKNEAGQDSFSDTVAVVAMEHECSTSHVLNVYAAWIAANDNVVLNEAELNDLHGV